MVGRQFRKSHRQACTADNHLGAPFDGRLDERFEIGKSDHNIDADDAIRSNFVRLAQLSLKSLSFSLEKVFTIIKPAIEGYAGRGNQSDTTVFGNMAGQPAGRYSNTHTALNKWIANRMLPNC